MCFHDWFVLVILISTRMYMNISRLTPRSFADLAGLHRRRCRGIGMVCVANSQLEKTLKPGRVPVGASRTVVFAPSGGRGPADGGAGPAGG